jgi:hypothetical protein
VFECFTVEDEHRDEKIAGETRIPAGVYPVTLRDKGGMTERYREKFSHLHRGMLWLRDVPNFEYVYIHIGNTDDNTSGCILVNNGVMKVEDGGYGMSSSLAYVTLYEKIIKAMDTGETVYIVIED